MDENQARQIIIAAITRAELEKAAEKEAKKVLKRVRKELLAMLFPEQLAVVNDPARRIFVLTPRRSGKTFCLAVKLLLTALKSRMGCVFFALTRRSAKKILWRTLKKLTREAGIKAIFNEVELTCCLPGGGEIQLMGAADEGETDKLRGQSIILAVIDEAGFYGAGIVEDLTKNVLAPCMVDAGDAAQLIISGTPGKQLSGFWYEVSGARSQKAYSGHEWRLEDNPYIRGAKKAKAEARAANGWTETSPGYVREFLGRWVRDDTTLIYQFSRTKNLIPQSSAPPDKFDGFVLGIDLGWNDDTAFSIVGFINSSDSISVAVKSYKKPHLTVTQIAEEIQRLSKEFNLVSTVADAGGLGKTIVEELNGTHGLAVRAAEKKDKFASITALNADLVDGRLLLVEESTKPLVEEWEKLTTIDSSRLQEDPNCPNHCSDATLYAYRESRHFIVKPPHNPEIKGSANSFADRLYEREMERLRQKQDEEDYWDE